MSDITLPDVPRPVERNERPPLFYPNIANNRLIFHGTPTQEKRDQILAGGLLPPYASTVSRDTLARRMSFSDFHRYGGSGYIFAFRPEEDEIDNFNPQWGRTVGISREAGRIPQERIVFYVDGKRAYPTTRRIFQESRDALQNFIASGYDQSVLETNIEPLITLTEQFLKEQATFVGHTPTPDDIRTLSQELVWNELCGAITHVYDDISSIGDRLHKILSANPTVSTAQLMDLKEQELGKAGLFDTERFLNQVQLILRIPNLQGLGFEGFNYDIYGSLRLIQQKLESLQTQERAEAQEQRAQESPVQDTHRISKILAGLRNLRKKK